MADGFLTPETVTAGTVRCFGASQFSDVLVGITQPSDAIQKLVGGPVTLPGKFPTPVAALEAGVVPNSLFDGPPAYVIDFADTIPTSMGGHIVFAQQPICEGSPTSPETKFTVNGRLVNAWVDDVPVAAGVRGVVQNEGLFIDVLLAWSLSDAPSRDRKLEILAEWIGAVIP